MFRLLIFLDKLHNKYYDIGDKEKKEKICSQVLDVCGYIVKNYSEKYERELYVFINNLNANYLINKDCLADTEKAYVHLMEIINELIIIYPERYKPIKAVLTEHMGWEYYKYRIYDKYYIHLTQALEIYKQLAKDLPNLYHKDVEILEEILQNKNTIEQP